MQHISPQRQPQARAQPPQPGDDDRGRNSWTGARIGKAGERDRSADTAGGQARTNGDGDKKGAKSLAHVPCKFHKQGSCTAGKACPFSHDLTTPGTTKPVCQWYAKGSCKFGHKCALAHILPGQPMSYDRKNKRAAQAALREAQVGQDPNQPPTSPGREQQPQLAGQRQSGIGRSLRNSVDAGPRPLPSSPTPAPAELPNGWARVAGSTAAAVPRTAGASTTSPATSAPSFSPPIAATLPPVSPVKAATPSESDPRGRSPPTHPIATAPPLPIAPHPTTSSDPPPRPSPSTLPPSFTPSPSGLSQTLQFGSNGRSSVAAQVMLSQQSRRLSNNGASLSPPRLVPPTQPTRRAFATTELLSGTPPLAVPSAIPTNGIAGGSGSSIFGTSPFSGPRALFMPSSYDSNDDNFPRSPPSRSGLEEMRRTNGVWDGRGGMYAAEAEEALEDDEDDYEEGFLPSSLNDLLTPEEQRRRASRMAGFDPFLNSRSVPTDLMLSHRPNAWGTMPSSPPLPTRSLLSVTHSFAPSSSPSFAPSSPSFAPHVPERYIPYPSSYDPTHYHPPAPHAPGSLPGGLAAGLSTLHLIPAMHTGETPPPVSVGFLGASTGVGMETRGVKREWGEKKEKRAGWDDEIQFDMD